MYLIEVFPILSSAGAEPLTYFHKESLPKGALVEIELRKKTVKAIVAGSGSARESKGLIKRSDFSLKRIENILALNFLSEAFLKTAWVASDHFASSFGAVLAELIPAHILNYPMDIPEQAALSDKGKGGGSIIRAFMGDETFRFENYFDAIYEKTEKNRSVFFLSPTLKDVKNTYHNVLKRGFSKDKAFMIHGGLSRKEFLDQWDKAVLCDDPVVICGTSQALCLPRNPPGVIILEKENSNSFRTIRKPYMDLRVIAEIFAGLANADLLLGDSVLTPSSFSRFKGDALTQKGSQRSEPTMQVVDMTMEEEKTESSAFSKSTLQYLKLNPGRKAFLYVNRKGIARVTVCNDCGETVACKTCDLPLSLQSEENSRYFLCNLCRDRSSAKRTCSKCSSWHLVPLGSGIEKVEADIRRLLPESPLFRLDSSTVKTEKKALAIMYDWNKNGGILLGTYKAIPYLKDPDSVVIVSLDSLLAQPGIDNQVEIIKLLSELKKITDSIWIQSRHGDYGLISKMNGGIAKYLEEDLGERKRFGYPPFKTFVKITAPVKDSNVVKDFLIKLLPEGAKLYVNLGIGKGGIQVAVLLVKLEADAWPHKPLVAYLKKLPPYIKTEVNPEKIF